MRKVFDTCVMDYITHARDLNRIQRAKKKKKERKMKRWRRKSGKARKSLISMGGLGWGTNVRKVMKIPRD